MSGKVYLGDLSRYEEREILADLFCNLNLGCEEVEGVVKTSPPHLRRYFDYFRWVQVPEGATRVVLRLTVGDPVSSVTQAEWYLNAAPGTPASCHRQIHDPFFHFEKRRVDDYLVFSDRFYRQNARNTDVSLKFFDSKDVEITTPVRCCAGALQIQEVRELQNSPQPQVCQVALIRRDCSNKLVETQIDRSWTLVCGTDGVAKIE